MNKTEIHTLKRKQEEFFLSGKTLDVEFRLKSLKALYKTISKYRNMLQEALYADLGKSKTEADMCEISISLSEISFMLKHTRKYSKPKRVKTNLANYIGSSFSHPSPYGNTLIMSPWNYPILLTIEPLCDALAAGNTCIIKPSLYSPQSSRVLEKIIKETFNEEYVAVVTGGREENQSLLEERFDYIFFTGSKNVGKLVMEKAAKHLTPVTLELGGKSPVIVTKKANLKLAAKRIVFGKFLNCGQTCVAPDYILVEESVKERLKEELIKETIKQFSNSPLTNSDYGKIISKKHFDRLISLINTKKIVHGGSYDEKSLKIEPTILDNITLEDNIMKEEIFGPLLPLISFKSLEEAVKIIRTQEHPLAFYIFSENSAEQKDLISSIGFGGGCINDTIMHLATSHMGFGGFGESGMGQYHGKAGFDTFTHYKSIVKKATWIDIPLRYQPYNEFMHRIINLLLR